MLIDFKNVFETLPGKCVLLQNDAPKFTILAASASYLLASVTAKQFLIGRGIFEKGILQLQNPNDSFTALLKTSLTKVLSDKQEQKLPFNKYALTTLEGRQTEYYWSVINTPVLDCKGEISYIIHTLKEFDEEMVLQDRAQLIVKDEVAKVSAQSRLAEIKNISLLDSTQFHGLLEAIPHMTWTNLPDGTINFYNQQWNHFTGLTYELLKGDEWKTVIHADDVYAMGIEMTQALTTGNNYIVESRFKNFEGNYRWHLSRAVPIKTETGEIILWVGTATDIHDLKEADRKLMESEHKYRMLVQNAPFPLAVYTGEEMRIELANKSIIDIWGKGNDVVGKLHQELLPELHQQDIISQLDKVFSTGIAFEGKNKKVTFINGAELHEYYLDYCITPLYDIYKNIYGVMATAANVTQMSVAKQKIEESEQLFRTMAEGSSILIKMSNEKGDATYFNKPWEEFTGKPMAEMLHYGWAKLVHPDDIESLLKCYAKAVEDKKIFTGEYRMLNINGEYRWLLSKAPPRFNPDGSFAGYISSSIDITDRKLGEDAVRQSAEKFSLVANAMLQFIWTKDAAGTLNYFNQAIIDYSGFSIDRLENEGLIGMMHPDEEKEAMLKWKEAFNNGHPYKFTHRFKRHDGIYRWFLSNNTPQRDNLGNIHTWVGTSTDIHDIKEQDEQKDFFIGMVSHELKTPFTSINGYVQILQTKYAATEDIFLKNALGIIKKQIGKATKIISDLLDVSKIKLGRFSLNKENFELNLLVKEVIDEVQLINNIKRIQFSMGPAAMVFADREKIGQVIINLLSNAIKYSAEDTIVTVRSKIEHNNIIISFTDRGIGINKTDQEKIFERFYRVEGKDEYQFTGFGIGLFIIAEIINHHEGKVGVESELGNGAVFSFSLACI